MSVNWDMSIEKSLSRNDKHPNKIEIEAIKAHLHKMGFKFKPTKFKPKKNDPEEAYCYVEMISQFNIEKGLKFKSQTGILYYNPKSPLRDLLHELDHIYQLQEEAKINKRTYLKATALNIKLVDYRKSINIPRAITELLFEEVINKNSFKIVGKLVVNFKTTKPRSVDISIGQSHLYIQQGKETSSNSKNISRKGCQTIFKFVNEWNDLKETEQKELIESVLSHYDNEEMEAAAYAREIKRAKMFSGLRLDDKELTSLKDKVHNIYQRFHGESKTLSICRDSWYGKSTELKLIPHLYLESRGYIDKANNQNDFDSSSSMLFFSPKEEQITFSTPLKANLTPGS